LRLFPSDFRTIRIRCTGTEMALDATIVAFALRYLFKGSFPAIDIKRALRVSVCFSRNAYLSFFQCS